MNINSNFLQFSIRKHILPSFLFLMLISDRVVFRSVFFGYDIRAWQILLIGVFLCLMIDKSVIVSKRLLFCLISLIAYTFLTAVVNLKLYFFTIVQIALVFSTLIIAYSLVKKIKTDVALHIYCKAAVFLALSVILQEIVYLLLGVDLVGSGKVGPFIRVCGLVAEPSQIAIFIVPALLYTFIWKCHNQSFLLILAAIFSFSALAYASLLVVFLLYFIFLNRGVRCNLKAVLYFLVFICLLFSAVISPEVNIRLKKLAEAPQILGHNDITLPEYQELNGSVATLLFNANVAWQTMADSKGLGVGFGAFRYAFDNQAHKLIDIEKVQGLFYNRLSGGSLLIRCATELGWVGIIVLFLLLFSICRRYIKLTSIYNCGNKKNLCAATGIFLVIYLMFIIRKDMWLNFPLSLFVVMYVQSRIATTPLCQSSCRLFLKSCV